MFVPLPSSTAVDPAVQRRAKFIKQLEQQRYGKRVITLSAGRMAIAVGHKGKLVSMIVTVITAAKAGKVTSVFAAEQADHQSIVTNHLFVAKYLRKR